MSTKSVSRAVGILVLALASGCGTVCEDAATICGFDETTQPEDCSGVNECASLCIIDQDSCAVNDPETAESVCIARCLEASEEGS